MKNTLCRRVGSTMKDNLRTFSTGNGDVFPWNAACIPFRFSWLRGITHCIEKRREKSPSIMFIQIIIVSQLNLYNIIIHHLFEIEFG